MTSGLHALIVAGARPNFMKVKPVLKALEERGARATFVHTGQHYDPAMSEVFLDVLGLRRPDHQLGVGSGSHAVQTAGIMVAFEPLLAEVAPDVVVVVGDVNSTLATALVAAKDGVALAHVEAGLRSHDWSMPEEVNRVVVDRISDLLFATSADASSNLRREGVPDHKIHFVGNTMVDSLLANIDRAREMEVPKRLGMVPGEYGVVTLHRPANVDEEGTLRLLLGVLAEIATDLPLIFPAHPRTRQRIETWATEGVSVTGPLDYLDFLGLIADSRLVLTDSGGIQEETTVLGVPCLTLREQTERPITVTEGTNRLVGRDPQAVRAAAAVALRQERQPHFPALWDGHAGERIADILIDVCSR